jgi:DNA polymerase III alpha subunit
MKELSTQLVDRKLRFDGVSVVDAEMVAHLLLRGVEPKFLRVTETNWEIDQFNLNVPDDQEIRKDVVEPVSLDLKWRLPKEFFDLDLGAYVVDKMSKFLETSGYAPEQENQAIERVAVELEEIHQRGMIEFFKTVIYILETFKQKNVIWGVGRGSSCASYVLFILGLHSVDCIKLDVPMSEFFHD